MEYKGISDYVPVISQTGKEIWRNFTKAIHALTGEEGEYHNLEGNFAAHLSSALTGVSLSIPVEDGRLALGAWQSIYLMEFDGSRKRKVRVKFMEDDV